MIDRTSCPARFHGTVSAYKNARCRCRDACIKRTRYDKRHRAGLIPPAMVPAIGMCRRLRALAAIGHTTRSVSLELGRHEPNLVKIRLHGDKPGFRLVSREIHEEVARLYEAWCMTPGTDDRARSIARKYGWRPPLAWDDIDDPAEKPDQVDQEIRDESYVDPAAVDRCLNGDLPEAHRSVKAEAVRVLAGKRKPDREIAELIGCTERTVLRIRKDFGIPAGNPECNPNPELRDSWSRILGKRDSRSKASTAA